MFISFLHSFHSNVFVLCYDMKTTCGCIIQIKTIDVCFQNNKALQEACSLLEEQLNDLEKLADLNEVKNKELDVCCIDL